MYCLNKNQGREKEKSIPKVQESQSIGSIIMNMFRSDSKSKDNVRQSSENKEPYGQSPRQKEVPKLNNVYSDYKNTLVSQTSPRVKQSDDQRNDDREHQIQQLTRNNFFASGYLKSPTVTQTNQSSAQSNTMGHTKHPSLPQNSSLMSSNLSPQRMPTQTSQTNQQAKKSESIENSLQNAPTNKQLIQNLFVHSPRSTNNLLYKPPANAPLQTVEAQRSRPFSDREAPPQRQNHCSPQPLSIYAESHPEQKRQNYCSPQPSSMQRENSPQQIFLSPRNLSPIEKEQQSGDLTRQLSPKRRPVPYYSSEVYTAITLRKSGQRLSNQHEIFIKHITQTFEIMKLIKQTKLKQQTDFKPATFLQSVQSKLDSSKKTIMLDLDETLIHSEQDQNKLGTFLIKVRPYALDFVKELKRHFNVGIFTASDRRYSEQIIRKMDPKQNIFNVVLYRECCYEVRPRMLVKDLTLLGHDLAQVVMIDNMTSAFALNLSNGIPIIPFFEDEADSQLRTLLSFLKNEIYPAKDVRTVIDKKFKFKDLINFRDQTSAVLSLYAGEQ